MVGMTVGRLHELFDKNPEKEILAWPGKCHDCDCDVQVTATPRENGIHIEGGGVSTNRKLVNFFSNVTPVIVRIRS